MAAAAAGVAAVHVSCAGVQGFVHFVHFVLVGRRRNDEGAFFPARVRSGRKTEGEYIIMSPLRQRTPYYSVASCVVGIPAGTLARRRQWLPHRHMHKASKNEPVTDSARPDLDSTRHGTLCQNADARPVLA